MFSLSVISLRLLRFRLAYLLLVFGCCVFEDLANVLDVETTIDMLTDHKDRRRPRSAGSQVRICRRQGTPKTNYGIAIAHLKGILDKVSLP